MQKISTNKKYVIWPVLSLGLGLMSAGVSHAAFSNLGVSTNTAVAT